MCPCSCCGAAPLANGGEYTVEHGKVIKDHPLDKPSGPWFVLGPDEKYKHVKVRWGFATEQQAKDFADGARQGIFPPIEE
jgi:hypothetical protein